MKQGRSFCEAQVFFSRAVSVVLATVATPDQPVHRAADERLVRRKHGCVEVDAGVVVDGDFHAAIRCQVWSMTPHNGKDGPERTCLRTVS
jgi:hypothetical protein